VQLDAYSSQAASAMRSWRYSLCKNVSTDPACRSTHCTARPNSLTRWPNRLASAFSSALCTGTFGDDNRAASCSLPKRHSRAAPFSGLFAAFSTSSSPSPTAREPTTQMKARSTSLAPSPIWLMRASRIIRSSGSVVK